MGAPMGTPTPFVSQPAVNPAQGGKGASSSPSGSYSQMFANPAANQFGASPNTRYVPKQYTTSTLAPAATTTAPLAPTSPAGSGGEYSGSTNFGSDTANRGFTPGTTYAPVEDRSTYSGGGGSFGNSSVGGNNAHEGDSSHGTRG